MKRNKSMAAACLTLYWQNMHTGTSFNLTATRRHPFPVLDQIMNIDLVSDTGLYILSSVISMNA